MEKTEVQAPFLGAKHAFCLFFASEAGLTRWERSSSHKNHKKDQEGLLNSFLTW